MHDENKIKELNKKIELNPKDSKAYSLLGQEYALEKKYDKAIKVLKEAINIDLTNSFAYSLIGAVYTLTDEYNKAIEYLNIAIRIDAKNSLAYFLLGIIYYEKEEYDKAIQFLNEVIKIVPDDSDAYSVLGTIYHEKKEYNDAIKNFNKAIELNPKNLEYYKFIARSYFKIQDYDNSFENLLKSKEELILNFLYSFKEKFKKNITAESKEILLKVYFLHDSLRIKDVDSFKKENKYSYLYQYRKFDFLEIVLKNKNFWLNPTDYQNDPHEGSVFFDYINCETENINSDFVAFISCFSALKDNLIMWNSSYAEDGKGISIGVDVEKISNEKYVIDDIFSSYSISQKDKSIEKEMYIDKKTKSFLSGQEIKEANDKKESIPINKVGLYKILYINLKEEKIEEQDSDKESKKLLEEIRESYKKITKAYETSHREEKQKINNWLNELFILIRYLVKLDDYKHEKEYRLLYICDIKNNNKYVRSQRCLEGVHVETEEILFNNEKKQEKIFIGPKNNSRVDILKINHYLKCEKLDRYIELEPSKIKFR